MATEILSSFRTVIAFGGEQKEGERCVNDLFTIIPLYDALELGGVKIILINVLLD